MLRVQLRIERVQEVESLEKEIMFVFVYEPMST